MEVGRLMDEGSPCAVSPSLSTMMNSNPGHMGSRRTWVSKKGSREAPHETVNAGTECPLLISLVLFTGVLIPPRQATSTSPSSATSTLTKTPCLIESLGNPFELSGQSFYEINILQH